MKIIRNQFIPFKGFTAITIWPFVFVRTDADYTDRTDRHECIHGRQQREAYANQLDKTYFSHRCPFAWWRYILSVDGK